MLPSNYTRELDTTANGQMVDPADFPRSRISFVSRQDTLNIVWGKTPDCPDISVALFAKTNKCLGNDVIFALLDGGERVGGAPVRILVPTSETAEKTGTFGLSFDACSRLSLKNPEPTDKCIYDEYRITYQGPAGMDLIGITTSETVQQELPLIINGVRKARCVDDPPSEFERTPPPFESGPPFNSLDAVGWRNPKRKDCGATALQTLFVGDKAGGCKFKNSHTKILDKQGRIFTARDDEEKR